ncbi:MFS transporter [Amycolatopsis sp. GM8]|uniref:MFS transporter n=1 Tax=Amycolatopsis sp. GM8 TaxID=2896530 RepID=UPI001F001032|nr:MFS transporter [Amycolatopsis sp. GM8]
MRNDVDIEHETTSGWRRRVTSTLLVLPVLAVSIDSSVLLLALPRLSTALGASGTEQLWIVDIYVFMLSGFLIPMGGIGDQIGQRKVLFIGAGIFSASSIMAAYADNVAILIAARALMGIGGSAVMSLSMAIASTIFTDYKDRATAIAIRASTMMVGGVVGPAVGGVILKWFWWGSVFLVSVPPMLLLLAFGPRLLPGSRSRNTNRTDWTSVAALLCAVLLIVYGVKATTRGEISPTSIGVTAAGAVIGVFFWRRQGRIPNPLLDPRIFRSRVLTLTLTVMVIGTFVLGGIVLFVPTYLQTVRGASPLEAGLWLIPQSIATIAATLAVSRLSRRLPLSYLLASGLSVAAAGCLAIVFLAYVQQVPFVVVGSFLVSVGMVPVASQGANHVMFLFPRSSAGIASSVVGTNNQMGSALGVAVLGSAVNAVYRVDLKLPDSLGKAPGDTARQAINEAAAIAARLQGTIGQELLAAARSAFLTGLRIAGLVSVILLTICLVITFVFLRERFPAKAKIDKS